MVDINKYLDGQLKPYLATLAAAIAAFVAAMNYLTGPGVSFLALYLVPILMIVWIAGRLVGVALAVVCTAGWFLSEMLTTPVRATFYANPFVPSWNVIIQMGVFLIVIDLVAALKKALLQEQALARTDFLTGVANMRYFSEIAAIELNRARRYDSPLTIAYLDIDNFKAVNDRLGHLAGDHLLQQVAKTIKDHLRNLDMVARFGGDEFVVLMPGTKLEQTKTAIGRIRTVLLEAMQKNQWPVTFSVGVIGYQKPPQTIGEAIKAADGLMYSAKTSGKNAVLYENR